jgi:hypothetical protein
MMLDYHIKLMSQKLTDILQSAAIGHIAETQQEGHNLENIVNVSCTC